MDNGLQPVNPFWSGRPAAGPRIIARHVSARPDPDHLAFSTSPRSWEAVQFRSSMPHFENLRSRLGAAVCRFHETEIEFVPGTRQKRKKKTWRFKMASNLREFVRDLLSD
jgi:hypothetical protein